MVCDEQMSNWGPQLPPSAPPSPLPIALCHSGQSVSSESSFLRHPCPDPVTCMHKKGQPGIRAASVHMALTEKGAALDSSHSHSFPLTPSSPSSSFLSHLAKNSSYHVWAFPFPYLHRRQILYHLSYQESLASKVNPNPHRRPHTGLQTQ